MPKSHEKFHSHNGKRLVLIADDEFVNRELLRAVLDDSYELIFAENGEEALKEMRLHKATLSLVLLDLIMPVMGGMDMLRIAKSDPDITLAAEDRPIGGLGIMLVRQLMDEVLYERKDNQNILTLKKKI